MHLYEYTNSYTQHPPIHTHTYKHTYALKYAHRKTQLCTLIFMRQMEWHESGAAKASKIKTRTKNITKTENQSSCIVFYYFRLLVLDVLLQLGVAYNVQMATRLASAHTHTKHTHIHIDSMAVSLLVRQLNSANGEYSWRR